MPSQGKLSVGRDFAFEHRKTVYQRQTLKNIKILFRFIIFLKESRSLVKTLGGDPDCHSYAFHKHIFQRLACPFSGNRYQEAVVFTKVDIKRQIS